MVSFVRVVLLFGAAYFRVVPASPGFVSFPFSIGRAEEEEMRMRTVPQKRAGWVRSQLREHARIDDHSHMALKPWRGQDREGSPDGAIS
jgi:hypothetical protein